MALVRLHRGVSFTSNSTNCGNTYFDRFRSVLPLLYGTCSVRCVDVSMLPRRRSVLGRATILRILCCIPAETDTFHAQCESGVETFPSDDRSHTDSTEPTAAARIGCTRADCRTHHTPHLLQGKPPFHLPHTLLLHTHRLPHRLTSTHFGNFRVG